ncbi:MAG TPA: metabolite traffic protein EboE [Candidatus Angelobacter sp.]|nr:metabolite traffic protein EboE [Candidatus Angelobacter sp.]
MKLNAGLHLAYCTNVHRGETWAETFDSLNHHTLRVRERVCPKQPYAIGLRLSNQAAHELAEPNKLLEFQRWMGKNHCYVFTINGFPFGRFHGGKVKENVYWPDWTTPERLEYTKLLFDLLARFTPEGVEASVSTLPGSFKGFPLHGEDMRMIRENLWRCVEHIARLSEQTGRKMHLGLEPEPLCLLESSGETIQFFDRMRAEHHRDPRLAEHLGVNYDTCHFAVEFEEPANALGCLVQRGIKISKIHLSSALKARPTAETRAALAAFAEDVYLHQVVVCRGDGQRFIYRDLDEALAGESDGAEENMEASEWRIHFHIPLYSPPTELFDTTSDHIEGVLDLLATNPGICSHLEMETYTWEVLPENLKDRDVVEQIAAEYDWTLENLRKRGLA